VSGFSFVQGLRCVGCGRDYAIETGRHTCPSCGPLLGTLDLTYNYRDLAAALVPAALRARQDATIWRYHELLPIRDPLAVPRVPVGLTPLYLFDGDLDFPVPRALWLKDDTRHPSGSAKDRATAVGIANAREVGAKGIAAASTGNAASSLALFAAREALPCLIFVPAAAPAAKLAQIRAHGATCLAVDGNYDQAFELCAEVSRRHGYYNRSTAVNPYLGEGKKTIALEIWEQLGFRIPDVVVVPVGDGCILGGVHKGFRDLREAGLVYGLPRLIGIQADGSAALARAWQAGKDRCDPVEARTVADSLAVSMPRDQVKALRAVRETNGAFLTVSDDEILRALSLLAARCGIFVEPAAAAALEGLRRGLEEGAISPAEEVTILLTGHGLKDIEAACRASAWNEPLPIAPEVGAVEAALEARARELGTARLP